MFDIGLNHIKLLKELRAFGDSVKTIKADMNPDMMADVIIKQGSYAPRTRAAVGAAFLSSLEPAELHDNMKRIADTVRAMDTPAALAVMAIIEHAATAITTEKR